MANTLLHVVGVVTIQIYYSSILRISYLGIVTASTQDIYTVLVQLSHSNSATAEGVCKDSASLHYTSPYGGWPLSYSIYSFDSTFLHTINTVLIIYPNPDSYEPGLRIATTNTVFIHPINVLVVAIATSCS